MNELEPHGLFITYDSIADKQSREAKLARIELYVEWFATPAGERSPSTKKELAGLLGVSYETLRDYESDPEFQRRYMERVGKAIRVERLGNVLDAMYKKALDHESPQQVQAAKALLDWTDKHTPDAGASSLEDMSLEDIVEELIRRGVDPGAS